MQSTVTRQPLEVTIISQKEGVLFCKSRLILFFKSLAKWWWRLLCNIYWLPEALGITVTHSSCLVFLALTFTKHSAESTQPFFSCDISPFTISFFIIQRWCYYFVNRKGFFLKVDFSPIVIFPRKSRLYFPLIQSERQLELKFSFTLGDACNACTDNCNFTISFSFLFYFIFTFCLLKLFILYWGVAYGPDGKESACNAGDLG